MCTQPAAAYAALYVTALLLQIPAEHNQAHPASPSGSPSSEGSPGATSAAAVRPLRPIRACCHSGAGITLLLGLLPSPLLLAVSAAALNWTSAGAWMTGQPSSSAAARQKKERAFVLPCCWKFSRGTSEPMSHCEPPSAFLCNDAAARTTYATLRSTCTVHPPPQLTSRQQHRLRRRLRLPAQHRWAPCLHDACFGRCYPLNRAPKRRRVVVPHSSDHSSRQAGGLQHVGGIPHAAQPNLYHRCVDLQRALGCEGKSGAAAPTGCCSRNWQQGRGSAARQGAVGQQGSTRHSACEFPCSGIDNCNKIE